MYNSRIKAFVNRNRKKITEVAIGGGIGLVLYGAGLYLYCKGYNTGAKAMVFPAFHETINWFDKTFDNVHLQELWDQWALAHPEQVITTIQ